jgi:hypothetical protein
MLGSILVGMSGAWWRWAGAVLLAAIGCGGGETSGSIDGSSGVAESDSAAAEGSSTSSDGSTTLPPLPPDPSADGGPSMPGQTDACEIWVACAMAIEHPDVDAIIDEYGSLGSCWVDVATATACDAACGEALDTTRAESETMGSALPDACDPPRDVPLSEIVAILDAHCVDACHEPGGEHPSLDLSDDPRGETILVLGSQASIPHVVPGDHEGSYLWHKVSGSQGRVGGMGARMPAGAPPLQPGQIEAIADWIDIGAPP